MYMALAKLHVVSNFIQYISDQMDKAKPPISQNELARALDMDPSQVSRWFTTNPKRKVSPNLATAEKIEEALNRLLKGRKRSHD
jgi:ribosome-binding protein aMBF1 (putative translation factor)